jgi:hypothetical protein
MAFFNIMENPSEKPTRKIRYKFKKEERLSSKKMIDKLFAEGTSFLYILLKLFISILTCRVNIRLGLPLQ